MRIPMMAGSLLIASTLLIGCGPSGRELSDQQWLDLQQTLQQERSEIGQQRDQLELDRRQWDERERSEPVRAAAISAAALLLACGLPLLVVTVLLWPRPPEPSCQAVCDVLLESVVSSATPPPLDRLADQRPQAKLAPRQS